MMKKLFAILLLCVSSLASAALTDAQYIALKADILADPLLSADVQAGNYGAIADAYNVTTTYVVWKTSVTDKEIQATAAFDWTRVDNLSVGKARIWDLMFKFGAINPSLSNVRAGIDATWVGTAADLAVRAAVYTNCKRFARRIEKLFATGTGTDVSPSVMSFEGSVPFTDVRSALLEH